MLKTKHMLVSNMRLWDKTILSWISKRYAVRRCRSFSVFLSVIVFTCSFSAHVFQILVQAVCTENKILSKTNRNMYVRCERFSQWWLLRVLLCLLNVSWCWLTFNGLHSVISQNIELFHEKHPFSPRIWLVTLSISLHVIANTTEGLTFKLIIILYSCSTNRRDWNWGSRSHTKIMHGYHTYCLD
jgi:hypothetical protein